MMPRALPTVLLAVGAVAVAALLLATDPNSNKGALPPCLLWVLTGLFCPGCGAARCLHALLHGDLPTALAMNPLLVAVLPVLGWLAVAAAGWLPARLNASAVLMAKPVPWLVLLVGYGVLRNMPFQPFSWLAPG